MKVSFYLFLIGLLFTAETAFSQSKKVNIHVRQVSVTKLFEEIRKQSGYSFFFNNTKMASIRNISMDKNNVTVADVLNEVLQNTPFTYKMVDDVIVIQEREVTTNKQSERTVLKGVVSDATTGETLIGARIMLLGAKVGTMTDVNGNFELVLPASRKAILVSFLGYESREVTIGNQTFINIKLKQTAKEIGEVVVTGYQVIDKRQLTSAISTIKAKDLEKMGALTVDQMLEGKATGLMVTSLSTTPGAATKVRVRSGSTFTGVQEPLWVVDGVIYTDPVPLKASDINSFDNINLIGNAITGINPQDIESINVLKDASATAIYGTRAANGVIVITTKRGKEGSPGITFRATMNYQDRPHYTDMNLMNSKDRIDVSREMYQRNLGYVAEYPNIGNIGYEGALKQLWAGNYTYDQFRNQVSYLETLNSDWFGALYRQALKKQYSLNASGGTSNVRYYFSFGYDDQPGTVKNEGLTRLTARSNLDMDLNKNVLISLRLNGSVQKGKYNHSSINAFNESYYTSRTVPVYDNDGNLFNQSKVIYTDGGGTKYYGNYNVLNEMANSARNINNNDIAFSAIINWKFLKNFRFNSQANYRNTSNTTEEWINEETFYIAKLRTYDAFNQMVAANVANSATVPFGGIYSGGVVAQDSYSITNQLNFNKVVAEKHVFNVNLTQEAQSTKYWGATGWDAPGYNHSQGRSFIVLPKIDAVAGIGLDVNSYNYKNMITWLTTNGSSTIYPTITDRISNSMSVFGVFNYVFDNRYVLNFNMRSDGSNQFGQYERYKFKPVWSTSARWNIHNEKFMDKSDLLEELALRVSYGFRGSMPNASPYLIISNYGRNNVNYYPENVASLSDFPNANLRWEKTSTVNAGLNFSMLKGRLSGALDYAYSKSTDLLQSRPISLVNGAAVQMYNSASKDVQSFEANARGVIVKTNSFNWGISANFSYDKDRVLKGFEEGATKTTVNDYLNGSIYRTGFPTNGFFSYQFNGLDSKGLPTFKNLVDKSGGSIASHLSKVLKYEGSRVPLYYGGFGTEFKYKNVSLSANFSYKLGYKIRLLSLYNGNQNMPYPYENMRSEFNARWRSPGDEATTTVPSLSDKTLQFTGTESLVSSNSDLVYVSNYGYVVPQGTTAWWMYDNSDARVVKGDHIRWQSMTVSYNFKDKWIKKLNLKNAQLGFQVSNIAVWSFDSKLKGQDPEQVNGLGLPSLPMYSISVNVGI